MTSIKWLASGFISTVLLAGCAGSKLGSAEQKETVSVKIAERTDVINYAVLSKQDVPSLASRGGNRGALSGVAGGAISLATSAIKQMIAKDKAKYSASYKQSLTDLYFYDQLSTQSAFDPVGMQFNGFRLLRTFDNEGRTDTAVNAEFELDTDHPLEILNNSIFRLKCKSFQLNYAKAKVAGNGPKKLNMDIEVIFTTSYVNADGVLFKNVELGRFYFTLRGAPLDRHDPAYSEYYSKLSGKLLDGKSFIVPRSFGYHVIAPNATEPSFSQGAYNIEINVKESSKNSFVNQLLIDNSGKVVDLAAEKVKTKIK